MQQSLYSPTHPTAEQPGGYHGVYLGGCCLFKPLGCGGFLKLCPQIGITGFVYIENHWLFKSLLQNTSFNFTKHWNCHVQVQWRAWCGTVICSRWWEGVQGCQPCSRWWDGVQGRQPCWRWWEEVRGVSHVQSDGRGVSPVQGDCRPGGWGASAMLKVIGGGVRGVSHVQGDGRGMRGVSHVQGDGRGVRGVMQPCSRW